MSRHGKQGSRYLLKGYGPPNFKGFRSSKGSTMDIKARSLATTSRSFDFDLAERYSASEVVLDLPVRAPEGQSASAQSDFLTLEWSDADVGGTTTFAEDAARELVLTEEQKQFIVDLARSSGKEVSLEFIPRRSVDDDREPYVRVDVLVGDIPVADALHLERYIAEGIAQRFPVISERLVVVAHY